MTALVSYLILWVIWWVIGDNHCYEIDHSVGILAGQNGLDIRCLVLHLGNQIYKSRIRDFCFLAGEAKQDFAFELQGLGLTDPG